MNAPPYTIIFILRYRGEEFRVQTYPGQYYSLMSLISVHLAPAGFGFCSGMGSCGTCLVSIATNGTSVLRTTLSCDVPVDDDLANTVITIEDSGW